MANTFKVKCADGTIKRYKKEVGIYHDQAYQNHIEDGGNMTYEQFCADRFIEAEQPKTFVKFLIHPVNAELMAYFSYIKYGYNGYRNDLKVCYSHIGQHSACAPEYASECRYAKEYEYAPLKRELESLGYNLKVSVKNLTK